MAGKGKFLYILPSGEGYRVMVKKSDFDKYPENTTFSLEHGVGLPLSKMSTDDLFKVKAQIATELENRMDLDEVTEANLEKLKTMIKGAGSDVIAKLLRQTLDRLDVVSADEKRAKTRKQILEDELTHRMVVDGVSQLKFNGSIQAAYKQETVYNVGGEGWDTLYSDIVANTLAAQLSMKSEHKHISAHVDIDNVVDTIVDRSKAVLNEAIEVLRGRLRREKDIHDVDISEKLDLLHDIQDTVESADVDIDVDDVRDDVVGIVGGALIENIRGGLADIDAFGVIQKRLTSTTLNELAKQGEELPKGIVSQEIRKLKIKRTK